MWFREEKRNNLVFFVPTQSSAGWAMGVQGRSLWQTVAEGSQWESGGSEHWSLLAALCLHENMEGETTPITSHIVQTNSCWDGSSMEGELVHQQTSKISGLIKF